MLTFITFSAKFKLILALLVSIMTLGGIVLLFKVSFIMSSTKFNIFLDFSISILLLTIPSIWANHWENLVISRLWHFCWHSVDISKEIFVMGKTELLNLWQMGQLYSCWLISKLWRIPSSCLCRRKSKISIIDLILAVFKFWFHEFFSYLCCFTKLSNIVW